MVQELQRSKEEILTTSSYLDRIIHCDFPLDRLKIDRSFVTSISRRAHSSVLVDAMIAMGHSLGLRVLAEGVETAEELAYLKVQGCDEAQGFLFARPMPAGEVAQLFGRPHVPAAAELSR